MLLPAAQVLQEREARDLDAQDRRLTLLGLWIAALALLGQLWAQVAQFRKRRCGGAQSCESAAGPDLGGRGGVRWCFGARVDDGAAPRARLPCGEWCAARDRPIPRLDCLCRGDSAPLRRDSRPWVAVLMESVGAPILDCRLRAVLAIQSPRTHRPSWHDGLVACGEGSTLRSVEESGESHPPPSQRAALPRLPPLRQRRANDRARRPGVYDARP
jgi:hypothetical protein